MDPGPPPQPIRIVDIGEENIQIHWDKIEPVFGAKNLENRPICLVTAVGINWSFVLNYMNRFLKNKGAAGPRWMVDGDYKNADAPLSGFNEFGPFSPGIDLWPTGYTIESNQSKDIAVFLLHISTGREMATTSVGLLYEFGMSICDIVVFASKSEIHEQDFVDFCNAYGKRQNVSDPFISQAAFMVCQPNGQTKYGAPPGEPMLEKFLKTTSRKHPKSAKVIKDMMTQFGEIPCTLLPGACRENISACGFNGSFNQLDPTFVKHFRPFITSILEETLSAKRFGGADVTCERAVGFFRSCADQLCANPKIGAQVFLKPAGPPVLIQGSPIIKSRVADPEIHETNQKVDKQNGELKVPRKEGESTVSHKGAEISATGTSVPSVVHCPPSAENTPNAPGTSVYSAVQRLQSASKAPVSKNESDIGNPEFEEPAEPGKDSEEIGKLNDQLCLQLNQELADKKSAMSKQEQQLQIENFLKDWSTQLNAKNIKITEGSESIFRNRLKLEQQKFFKRQAKKKREEDQKEKCRELESDIVARVKIYVAPYLEKIVSLEQFGTLEDKKEELFQQIAGSRNPFLDETMEMEKAEFAKYCGNAFDSIVNESRANFQKLCGLQLEKRAEGYKKSVLDLFNQQIDTNTIERVSRTSRASAELFSDIRQKQLLAEFPAFTIIKLYHEMDQFDVKIRKLQQDMKNAECKIETKFREQICFSDQDFKIQITSLLTNLTSANTFVNLETYVNRLIQKYQQQNENALKVEMETISEAKNEIVNFYHEEMKAYIFKNSNCFKNDLNQFHAGLVYSVIGALQESLGYGQPPEFLDRELEILEQNLTTYSEKYRDMNIRNLDISRMKLANFFATRRSDYNSKMAELIALRGPYVEKRLIHEHKRIRDEVKKLFQMEIKNLVEKLEPELNQLQVELEKEFAKHQKTNGEQLERKREEDERQRVIDEDIRKKNEEAVKAIREEQSRKDKEKARAQQQRDEESRRTRSQTKQTMTTQFTVAAYSHDSASARTPSPAHEAKWIPPIPGTGQQSYAVAAGGKPVCIAIEFGLHYLRIGFMKANGEVQLIPGETGVDIFNTLTVRDRVLYVGANENSSDMPINVGELLCGVSPATETTVILKGGVHDLRVEEIFGIVLHEAQLRATKYLQKQVQEACIVVPVWLTLETKKAIEIGAKIAGFERTKLISEFVAAAMNFKCGGPCAVEHRLFITTSKGHFHAALFQFSSREVKMIKCGSTLQAKAPSQKSKLFHAVTLGIFNTDEKAKILQDVVGPHTKLEGAHVIVTDMDDFKEIKQMVEREYPHCKDGLTCLHDHDVVKGAAQWASKYDSDMTKVKGLAFYKILSQHAGNTGDICAVNDPPMAHIKPHKVINPPFKFLVHENVQGKQRSVGEFIVTPTSYEEAHCKSTFWYQTSGDGSLMATAKFGAREYQAKWKGSTLDEVGIANSVSKLNSLFS